MRDTPWPPPQKLNKLINYSSTKDSLLYIEALLRDPPLKHLTVGKGEQTGRQGGRTVQMATHTALQPRLAVAGASFGLVEQSLSGHSSRASCENYSCVRQGTWARTQCRDSAMLSVCRCSKEWSRRTLPLVGLRKLASFAFGVRSRSTLSEN